MQADWPAATQALPVCDDGRLAGRSEIRSASDKARAAPRCDYYMIHPAPGHVWSGNGTQLGQSGSLSLQKIPPFSSSTSSPQEGKFPSLQKLPAFPPNSVF
jgi:hypothetical protein